MTIRAAGERDIFVLQFAPLTIRGCYHPEPEAPPGVMDHSRCGRPEPRA